MRNIIRLDIKNNFVVKGRQFEGYRKIGAIEEFIKRASDVKRVELFLYDVVATLFDRNSITENLDRLLKSNFVPVTVGGGINSIEKAESSFRYGVDRIAINSIAFQDMTVIKHIVKYFGSQAAISHIEAKKIDNNWCAMHSSGREVGSKNLIDHINRMQDENVGEIILSSIDDDGMLNDFSWELLEHLDNNIFEVPVIISGGIREFDFKKYQKHKFISGLAISKAFLQGNIQ